MIKQKQTRVLQQKIFDKLVVFAKLKKQGKHKYYPMVMSFLLFLAYFCMDEIHLDFIDNMQ